MKKKQAFEGLSFKDKLEKLDELNLNIKEYEESHKIEFFKLLPHQKLAFDLIKSGKKTVTLQGANQIGKTVFGAAIVISFCLGIYPWSKEDTIFGNRPVKGRILCSDWEKHAAKVIVPELKKWSPAKEYKTSKNNVGVEAFFEFKTGSTLELLTNKQDVNDHEGWKGDFVWSDEPPQREKFVANKRGLIAANGLFLLTMTAVTESWVLDEIVLNTDPSYGAVTEIPITANTHLPEEGIRSFVSSLREDEKIARAFGGWLNLVGLIWKGFSSDKHIIDDFNIPPSFPVVAMIDWHTNKPIAVSFYAVDERDNFYLIDEVWQNGSAEEIADHIIKKKLAGALRIEEVFVDPLSKGDSTYVKNMGIEIKDTYHRLKERLAEYQIDLKVASKDKDSGIKNVEDRLIGMNGMPSLFFFRSTNNRYKGAGTIWEIQRWAYDENGKPKDENDHFVENLYRVTLTGLRYRPPRQYNTSNFAETRILWDDSHKQQQSEHRLSL